MNTVSPLWEHVPTDMPKRLEGVIDKAAARSEKAITAYFRADDIGVPGPEWDRLTRIFLRHRVPLAAAVVPAWMTPAHWQAVSGMGRDAPKLWCWHQHGWQHANHESSGKKQEFGPKRDPSHIRSDIDKGRHRLESVLGNAFTPIFTPPWNRCDATTMEHLLATGYRAVSRYEKSHPDPPDGLPDWFVNVDLHTRKEPSAEASWQALFNELHTSISEGRTGIMIHHLRMNDAAFDFLDALLKTMKRFGKIQISNWCDMKSCPKETLLPHAPLAEGCR